MISFARALAHNPRYLILDEATSSVDTETEFRVREALGRMVEGTDIDHHRPPAVHDPARRPHPRDAQRPAARTGTHQELLAQRGIYWKLYQLQYKDQDLAVAQEPKVSPR